MNAMFCRAFQCCFAVGARFLPWRTPEVFSGEGSLLRAADILRENGLRRPFVIASRRQCADEHFRALQEKLDEQDILLSIFSSVEPNPSVETVEKIAAQYKIDSCDCFLVIGGGSPMDAAKAAAARLARPDKPLSQLVGLLKVRRRIPPLIAVPTTAGTGSETTIAAVVTGSDHHKYAISDLCLIPRYAILDPALTVGLPPHITAETGMDAPCAPCRTRRPQGRHGGGARQGVHRRNPRDEYPHGHSRPLQLHPQRGHPPHGHLGRAGGKPRLPRAGHLRRSALCARHRAFTPQPITLSAF